MLPSGGDLRDAIAHLIALRAEHRPIMERIAGDGGMDPATRVELLMHLADEESEWMQTIASLASSESSTSAGGFTVGNLNRR